MVIPCRDGAATLARQLDALTNQEFSGDYEVIVADNGSSDGSREIVETYAERDSRFRCVDASGTAGINHARNTGVRASRGDFVLLCDADDEVSPTWLAAMDEARHRGHECLGGVIVRRLQDGTLLGVDPGVYDFPWKKFPRPIGANCGFSRRAYEAVEGFDETFKGGSDDTDFFWRAQLAGFSVHPVPAAEVTYYGRENLKGVIRQSYARGRMQAKLFRKFREHGMPRSRTWRLPVVVAAGTALAVVGSWRTRRYGVSLVANRVGRIIGSVAERTIYV